MRASEVIGCFSASLSHLTGVSCQSAPWRSPRGSRRPRVAVTLLRVIHPYWEPDAAVAEITELVGDDREAAEALAYLAEARSSDALADVASAAIVGIGSVAPAILAAAQENHVDLIVLFQHRRRPRLGRWPCSGITEQVVKHASAPVLALHERDIVPAAAEAARQEACN